MAVPMRSLARTDYFRFSAVREENSPASPNAANYDCGEGVIVQVHLYRS